MKTVFSFLVILCFLSGCGKDANCVVCENKNLNETSTVEICQEGPDLFVSTVIIEIKSDFVVPNATAAEYQKTWEAKGYTCE